MRHPLLVLAAACLTLTANAQDQQSSVQVTAPKVSGRYFIDPYQFQDYKRTYDLSDGQTMRFTNVFNGMYAQIGNGPQHRMVYAGNGNFQTVDQMITAHIMLDDNGDASGTVNYIPDGAHRAVAQTATMSSRLASR